LNKQLFSSEPKNIPELPQQSIIDLILKTQNNPKNIPEKGSDFSFHEKYKSQVIESLLNRVSVLEDRIDKQENLLTLNERVISLKENQKMNSDEIYPKVLELMQNFQA